MRMKADEVVSWKSSFVIFTTYAYWTMHGVEKSAECVIETWVL